MARRGKQGRGFDVGVYLLATVAVLGLAVWAGGGLYTLAVLVPLGFAVWSANADKSLVCHPNHRMIRPTMHMPDVMSPMVNTMRPGHSWRGMVTDRGWRPLNYQLREEQ